MNQNKNMEKLQEIIKKIDVNDEEDTQVIVFNMCTFHIQNLQKEYLQSITLEILNKQLPLKLFKSFMYYFGEKYQSLNINNLQKILIDWFIQFINKNKMEGDYVQKKQLCIQIFYCSEVYTDKMMMVCRQSQQKSILLFKLINDSLIKCKKDNIYCKYTKTTLHALKVIQNYKKISILLLSIMLKYLCIILLNNNKQMSELITNCFLYKQFLLQIPLIDNSIIPYWYFLIINLEITQDNNQFMHQKIIEKGLNQIHKTFLKKLNYNQQFNNLLHHLNNDEQKVYIILSLRAYSYFLLFYIQKYPKNKQYVLNHILNLMQIRDFLSYQYLIIALSYFDQSQVLRLSSQQKQIIFSSLINNCLHLFKEQQKQQSLQFKYLDNTLQDRIEYFSSKKSLKAYQKIFNLIIFQTKNNKNEDVYNPFLQKYIYQLIQKQYDNQFNNHQLISAVGLMCKSIKKDLLEKSCKIQHIKQYSMNKIKWLLNLNQSCLPQHRRCIHFKIFEIFQTIPQIIENNQYLQQVIQQLLIQKYPVTIHYIKSICKYYLKESRKHGKNDKLMKISKKLLKSYDSLKHIEQKIQLWGIIIQNLSNIKQQLINLIDQSNLNQQKLALLLYCLPQFKRQLQTKYQSIFKNLNTKIINNSYYYRDVYKLNIQNK